MKQVVCLVSFGLLLAQSCSMKLGRTIDPEAREILDRFVSFQEKRESVSFRVTREESVGLVAQGRAPRFARYGLRGFEEWDPHRYVTRNEKMIQISGPGPWRGGATASRGDRVRFIRELGQGIAVERSTGIFSRGSMVQDLLAPDPYREGNGIPVLPPLLDRTGDMREDAVRILRQGEEEVEGIPCVKLVIRYRRAPARQIWIATGEVPHLVQVRSLEEGAPPVRLSEWRYDGEVPEAIFGSDHRTFLESLDRPEDSS